MLLYHPTIPPYEGNQEFHSIGWVPGVSYTARLRIFALHSMIPRQEQEEVFNEVPKAGLEDTRCRVWGSPGNTDKPPRFDGCLEVFNAFLQQLCLEEFSFSFLESFWHFFDFFVRPIVAVQ